MKQYKLTTHWLKCITLGIISFAFIFSCDKSEELDTNQLSGSEVTVKSFGPSPIPRGAELRFIGTNLNKVESVEIPGSAPIKTIKVINKYEIRVTVPQDAEEGVITLKAGDKDIKTITDITYDEPITIDKISPTQVKPNNLIKIEGEYLNLIEEIIFAEDIHVLKKDFHSQSRKAIEVNVPFEAQTGKIIFSNGADFIPDESGEFGVPVWIYSEEDLQIILPTITEMTPQTVKAGTSELSIKGKDLDLTTSIIFGGEVAITEFSVNNDGTLIKVKVPATAQDGKVVLVAKSGAKSESAKDLIMLNPSNLAVSPKVIKNGDKMEITGKDLDIVTGIKFGELSATIQEKTATKIVLTVPEKEASLNAILTTSSNKTVETPAFAYVKPAITSINPMTIMAGYDITITGTNLDLVRSVKFVGADAVEVTPTSATSLIVTLPVIATSGQIDLIAVNGDIVTSNEVLNVLIADIPMITKISTIVKPGGIVKITGTKLNLVESVYYASGDKAIQFGTRSETLLEVYMPENTPKGDTYLTLKTFGSKEVKTPTFTIGGTDPVIDPSLMIIDFDNGLQAGPGWDGVGGKGNTADGISGDYYEISASNWSPKYWWFAENWMTHPSVSNKANYVVKIDIRLRNDIPANNSEVRMVLAGKAVNVLPYLLIGNNWSTGGDWKTISIPLTKWADLSDPTPEKGGEWGMSTWINNVNFTGFCIDNIRYEKVN